MCGEQTIFHLQAKGTPQASADQFYFLLDTMRRKVLNLASASLQHVLPTSGSPAYLIRLPLAAPVNNVWIKTSPS
jgi:hypothetical protein